MAELYQALRAELVSAVPETNGIKTLALRPERPFTFAPGQFAQLLVPGKGEAPFSPAVAPERPELLEITVMKRGRLTSLLHRLEPGAKLGLRGPYGRGFPLEQFAGKELILIAGGVGLAGIRSLLFEVLSQSEKYPRVVLLVGAKTPGELILREWLLAQAGRNRLELHMTVETSDDSWTGKKGLVTDLLEGIRIEPERSSAAMCGPEPMMKAAALELVKKGVLAGRIFLSLERNMSCGVGQCGHCRLGPVHVCKDGPVLTWSRLEKISEFRGPR